MFLRTHQASFRRRTERCGLERNACYKRTSSPSTPSRSWGTKSGPRRAKKLKNDLRAANSSGGGNKLGRSRTTIAYEQAADISGIKPHSSIFYELDCTQKMISELNTNSSVDGKQNSPSQPNGQFVSAGRERWMAAKTSFAAPPTSTPGGQSIEAGAQPEATSESRINTTSAPFSHAAMRGGIIWGGSPVVQGSGT